MNALFAAVSSFPILFVLQLLPGMSKTERSSMWIIGLIPWLHKGYASGMAPAYRCPLMANPPSGNSLFIALLFGLELRNCGKLHGQMYYTIKPVEALSDYVQFFWVLEGEGLARHPFVHRALADHCTELIFYYTGGFTRHFKQFEAPVPFASGIYAQSQHFSIFKTEGSYGLLGTYLYPYTFPLLFSTSAHVLSDQAIDLKDLWRKQGAIVEEKVMLAGNTAERVKIVSDFLIDRLKAVNNRYLGITTCIKNLVQLNQFRSVQSMIDYCNLSRRQFERKFKEYAGFSPKDYLRLVRFHAALTSPDRLTSMAKLAIDCGYYDQAHFIHDFTMFSGATPGKFFKQKLDPDSYRAFSEA